MQCDSNRAFVLRIRISAALSCRILGCQRNTASTSNTWPY